jgi:hypothetical protein
LRVRTAQLETDIHLREDRLDEREESIALREQLIVTRERDLSAYVGELQDQFSERSVA